MPSTSYALDDTPFAVIDFETTGFSAGVDRVVEVSIVRLDPGKQPRLVLNTLVNPMRPVAGTEVHGIADHDVANAPQFSEIVGELLDVLSGCVIAAYNVYFDMSFLNYELDNAGISHELPHLCVMRLRPMLGLGPSCKLNEACRLHGIVIENSHVAASDALATSHLLSKCLETARSRGIATFGELAELKNHKFLRSFKNDPFRSLAEDVSPPLRLPVGQPVDKGKRGRVNVFDPALYARPERSDAAPTIIISGMSSAGEAQLRAVAQADGSGILVVERRDNADSRRLLAGMSAAGQQQQPASEIPLSKSHHNEQPAPSCAEVTPPATEKQKEFARSLGIHFPPDISRRAISDLIDEALAEEMKSRFESLNEIAKREGEAWDEMRQQVLAEIEESDALLSKATNNQIVEELDNRGFAAVLLTIPWDEIETFDDIRGLQVRLCSGGDITLEEMEAIIVQLALTITQRNERR